MQFLFADYALDINRRELRRGSEPISIGPQVFDLLVYLVQNRERVVSKDDLLEAVWDGRIVSESTLTSHINAARKAVGDSGEEQRLIRNVARKGFRFVGEVSEETPSGAAIRESAPPAPARTRAPALALPDKPSIAVLPFQNMSGDPEQEYFADGMVEDIITALSRMRWLFVIARNSSFTYKGRAVDVKQVGRELGVRYVLEGSVRKAANRVRITGQLIDASTGAHLWADRFDGGLEDIFDLQDQMTASVVGAIAPKLEQAEIERAKRKPTENLDAYDLLSARNGEASSGDQGGDQRGAAAVLQGDRARPRFCLGLWHGGVVLRLAQDEWLDDRPRAGDRRSRDGLLDGRQSWARMTRSRSAWGGHALAFVVGDLDSGAALIDRALVLNPNLAAAWFRQRLGEESMLGEPETAIEHLAHAMRLSPLDPDIVQMQAGTGLRTFLRWSLRRSTVLGAKRRFRGSRTYPTQSAWRRQVLLLRGGRTSAASDRALTRDQSRVPRFQLQDRSSVSPTGRSRQV